MNDVDLALDLHRKREPKCATVFIVYIHRNMHCQLGFFYQLSDARDPRGKGVRSNEPTGLQLILCSGVQKYTWVLNSPFSRKDLKTGVNCSQQLPLTSHMSLATLFIWENVAVEYPTAQKRSKKCHKKMFGSAPAHIYTGTKIITCLLTLFTALLHHSPSNAL